MLKITQVRSSIKRKQDHKDTLYALGLRRIGQTVYHDDSSAVRGMVRKVSYLLAVAEVDGKDGA
jgi:large subunit ribosomal protein L30